jgi:hypothetical protein
VAAPRSSDRIREEVICRWRRINRLVMPTRYATGSQRGGARSRSVRHLGCHATAAAMSQVQSGEGRTATRTEWVPWHECDAGTRTWRGLTC